MKVDDRVRIDAFDTHGTSMFGAIDQQVASLRRRRAAAAVATESVPEAAALAPVVADAASAPADDAATAAGPTSEAVAEIVREDSATTDALGSTVPEAPAQGTPEP
jgi:hypothetical protein